MTREEGQALVVDTYDQTGHVLVLYATGYGKAKAALDAVKRNPGKRGLIVVHSEPARDITWPKEMEKWAPELMDDSLCEVIICCYQSLKSLPSGHYDWAIFDEAHYMTPNYNRFFLWSTVDKMILLTATMPEDPFKKQLLLDMAKNNVLKITLDEAIESGVLNNYKATVWNIRMTPLEESAYLAHCKACTQAFNSGNQNYINMKLGERMRFIYNLESKFKAGIYLRDQIRATGRRNVIFCGSIEMANKISPNVYHSGVTDAAYNRFLKKEINELASIKQIQEGANIPDLESALVLQINSKQLNLIQKLGRLMRLGEGKVAKIHILAVLNTVDINWVQKATKGLDQSKITHRILEPDLYMNV